MNGLEKIALGKRFDELSDTQKEDLYDKYGEDVVNEELERCRLAGFINDNDDISSPGAQSIADLFTSNEIEKSSDDIMEDIKKMLGN